MTPSRGTFIKQLRADLRLSQVALGEMLGVSGAAVCRWERGIRTPPLSIMRLLAAITGREWCEGVTP